MHQESSERNLIFLICRFNLGSRQRTGQLLSVFTEGKKFKTSSVELKALQIKCFFLFHCVFTSLLLKRLSLPIIIQVWPLTPNTA